MDEALSLYHERVDDVPLLIGLMLIILFPQLSLFLPKSAGFIK
jgi:hypothetical protein